MRPNPLSPTFVKEQRSTSRARSHIQPQVIYPEAPAVTELDSSEFHQVTDVVDPEWPVEGPPTEREVPKNDKRTTLMVVAACLTILFGAFLAWYMLQPPADFGAIPVESVNTPESTVAPNPSE
jgi:hypothetical protein